MRNGDFAVEVVPRGKGIGVREIGSGHVLARPGQVYALRLRNFGPLRCVADVRIDGRMVTAGGLVIDAWCTEELERPISPDENGRFTVVAEGDERALGTGLTGHSSQRFTPTQLGPLEGEATLIQLRLVIATAEAIDAARSPVDEPTAPERPAARP